MSEDIRSIIKSIAILYLLVQAWQLEGEIKRIENQDRALVAVVQQLLQTAK